MAMTPVPMNGNPMVAQVRGAVSHVLRMGNQPALRRAFPAILILTVTVLSVGGWLILREPARMTLFPGLAEADKARVMDALNAAGIDAAVDSLTGEVEVTGEGLEGDFHGLGELAQEAQVVVVEMADVIDAVDQHRDAFEAEAEGEAGPFVRVVAHVLEHRWVDDAGHIVNPTLAHGQLVGGLVNPSFLALNRAGDRLYAVHGDRSEASAFAVDRATGHLSLLNQVDFQGRNPVHLALDATERSLVVSSHLTGEVLVVAVDGPMFPAKSATEFEATLRLTVPSVQPVTVST